MNTEQVQPILLVVEDEVSSVEDDQYVVPLVNTDANVGISVVEPVTSFAPQISNIDGGVLSVGEPVFLRESTGQAFGGTVLEVSDPQVLSVSQPQVLSVSQPQIITVVQPQGGRYVL